MTELTEISTPFEFASVEIESSAKKKKKIEIKALVTDLDIFEHIDKPYLTAQIVFRDMNDFMSGDDIRGGDIVRIKLKQTAGLMKVFVEKEFRIDKFMGSSRTDMNNNVEVHVLHLIEKHWYDSTAQNVNKSYAGTATTILPKIAKEFLDDREVESSGEDVQNMKLIVPNMTPLDAMSWIKNRVTTKDGYPFYLYSSIVKDELQFNDLKTMMEETPWNKKNPHSYIAAEQNDEEAARVRSIKGFKQKGTDNLLTLIDKGLVGAKHSYYDVTTNQMHHVTFDLHKDVMTRLKDDQIQKDKPFYTEDLGLEDTPFNQIISRHTTQIGGTSAYDQPSLNESPSEGQYRLNVITRAMTLLTQHNSMSIIVSGIDFANKTHNSVGKTLDLAFLKTDVLNNKNNPYDQKKSGTYLIYAAKHSFKIDGYDVMLSCIKLTNGGYSL